MTTKHANDDAEQSRIAAAATQLREGAEAAKTAASDALVTVREKAGDAYETAREKASTARVQATQGIEANPLAVLAGGLALGAVIGALLPKSEREADLLAPVGDRVAGAARQAFAAAKDAGKGKLAELGLDRDSFKGKVDELVGAIGEAGKSAGSAAASTVRKG